MQHGVEVVGADAGGLFFIACYSITSSKLSVRALKRTGPCVAVPGLYGTLMYAVTPAHAAAIVLLHHNHQPCFAVLSLRLVLSHGYEMCFDIAA